MPTLREAVTTALLLASLLLTSVASGQPSATRREEPQAFRAEFAAPEGCGSVQTFTEEILKRTERLRLAEGREQALGFFAHLARTPEGVLGKLAIREVDGALTLREVPGHDCPEVLSAMALIAALTVDPLARADREVPVAERRKPSKPPPPRPRPPAPTSRPERPEPAAEPSAGIGFAVGQRVTAQSAVMPGISFGLGVHVEAISKAQSLFSPMLRVSALLSRSGALEEPPGVAELDWATARVSVCPLRFGSDHALSARPCAFLDAGRLHGEGSSLTPADERSVFWTAAGAEMTASARLTGPLRVGADVGIVLPFRRDRFIFEPDFEIHEVPAVGFSAGIGLGLLFF